MLQGKNISEVQIQGIQDRIKKYITYTFLILKERFVELYNITQPMNDYEIFEFDFIVDNTLNPYLISISSQVNTNKYKK